MVKVTTFLIVQTKINHVLTYAEMNEAFVAISLRAGYNKWKQSWSEQNRR